jgi:hypothetical protein
MNRVLPKLTFILLLDEDISGKWIALTVPVTCNLTIKIIIKVCKCLDVHRIMLHKYYPYTCSVTTQLFYYSMLLINSKLLCSVVLYSYVTATYEYKLA